MAYRQPEIKINHASGTVVTSTYQTEKLAPENTIRQEEKRYITTSQAKGRHSNVLVSQYNPHQNNDNLYRPLRETLAHPEIVIQHADYTPEAARSSMVSQKYMRLSTNELNNLQKNAYIPNARLVPTDNIERVRNEKFVAVDATQRIAGQPISQEEMERIRQQGFRSSQVVYEVRDEPEVEEEAEVRDQKDEKIRGGMVEERVEERPLQSYKASSYDSYGKYQSKYKYNAFSCIDQPVNQCRINGWGNCSGCPGNEFIARENHPPSVIRPV